MSEVYKKNNELNYNLSDVKGYNNARADRYILETINKLYYDNIVHETLDRFISFLKHTDMLMLDDGAIRRKHIYNMLPRIFEKIVNSSSNIGFEKTNNFFFDEHDGGNPLRRFKIFIDEIGLIQEIKYHYHSSFSAPSAPEDIFDDIAKLNGIQLKSLTDPSKITYLPRQFEVIADVMSTYIGNLMTKNLSNKNIVENKINTCNLNGEQTDFDYLQFKEVVSSWKYIDASISKGQDGTITVDATGAVAQSFVTSRNLERDNRQLLGNISKASDPEGYENKPIIEKMPSILYGLSEMFFHSYDAPLDETKTNCLFQFGQTKIMDISISDILYFLLKVHELIVKNNYITKKYFVSLDELFSSQNSKYLDQTTNIVRLLEFRGDLLDTPFINLGNGLYVVHISSMLVLDEIYVIYNLIRDDMSFKKTFGKKRGVFYEEEIANILTDSGHSFASGIKDKRLEFNFAGRQHEIDSIAVDTQGVAAVIEDKQFYNIYSMREFRLAIDKFISQFYFKKMLSHLNAVKKVEARNNYINRYEHNPENNKISRQFVSLFKNEKIDWNHAYTIVVSNVVLPIRHNVVEGGEGEKIFSLHWYEFNRLMKRIPAPDGNRIFEFNRSSLQELTESKTMINLEKKDKINYDKEHNSIDGRYEEWSVNIKKDITYKYLD